MVIHFLNLKEPLVVVSIKLANLKSDIDTYQCSLDCLIMCNIFHLFPFSKEMCNFLWADRRILHLNCQKD